MRSEQDEARAALRDFLSEGFIRETGGDVAAGDDAELIDRVASLCDLSLDPCEPLSRSYRVAGTLRFWAAVFATAAARAEEGESPRPPELARGIANLRLLS